MVNNNYTRQPLSRTITKMHPKVCLLGIFILSSIPVCFFGYNSDELWSNTIAYQIACGDKFLKQIWSIFFFPETLVAPFVWIYMKVAGGTTGIILYLRIIGCVFSAVVSFRLYDAIKQNETAIAVE